jgi:hypothetical protein
VRCRGICRPWPGPPGPAGSRPWLGLAVLCIVGRVDWRLPVPRVLYGSVGVAIGGRLASDSDGPCRAAGPPATPAEKKLRGCLPDSLLLLPLGRRSFRGKFPLAPEQCDPEGRLTVLVCSNCKGRAAMAV